MTSEKYILKYKNKIIDDINEIDYENGYKHILYLCDEEENEILLKNVKLNCYGVKIGNIYSTIAININKDNMNIEEKIFDSKINNVKKYIKKRYSNINIKNEYVYKNNFKSMYCKFNKDKISDEYRTFIIKNRENEHMEFDEYKSFFEGKIKSAKLYLQLIFILTREKDKMIHGQLSYNIKQIIFERPKPKPLF